MRILFTNNTLDWHAGTEIYVRDVALELLRRGRRPMAYSAQLGAVANELRAASVPVVDRLTALAEPPDLIHGQHHYDALTAILHYPTTPAIYFCHGWLPWQEAPLRHPRIYRYLAVDEACRERLMAEGGIAPERIDVVLNYYDARAIPPRTGPLPPRPKRALAFANEFGEARGLPALRHACRREGIQLDVIGRDSGRWECNPGTLLAGYDLIFAKARSAIEAMAAGAAVVLCNPDRCGPLVTTENFDQLRPWNFGIRTLTHELDSERISEQLTRYDAREAEAVTARVRTECELRDVVDRLETIYRRVLDEARGSPPRASAGSEAAVSEYLREQAPRLKEVVAIDRARQQWKLRAESAERQLIAQHERAGELESRLREETRHCHSLEREIMELRGSLPWRWLQALLGPWRWLSERGKDARP